MRVVETGVGLGGNHVINLTADLCNSTHFVITVQAPTIVRESLKIKVENHKTIFITTDVPASLPQPEVQVLAPRPASPAEQGVAPAATYSTHQMRAPTIVRESLDVEVEAHRTIIITADVEGQAAGNLTFSNEALRLSVVLTLPSVVRDDDGAEFELKNGTLVMEFAKAEPPARGTDVSGISELKEFA
ncbi:hypothetical protein HDU88_005739 [Geranomyces variabilis]|nr:hypothetical protein HDU88_005739 [Geranomyces variabilis]